MELSHEEKERLIAEEKLRFETVKNLQSQNGTKTCGGRACGSGLHGCCHCGAFWKGLFLGLVLSAFAGYLFHQHNCGSYGGRCGYGSSMMQNQDAPDTYKK